MHSPSKPDKRRCNYYQEHHHQIGKLEQCKHCQRYFCKSHLKPRPAGMRQHQNYHKLSKELQAEADNPYSHPCIPYTEYFERKIREKDEKYLSALDRFLGRDKQKKPNEIEPPTELGGSIIENPVPLPIPTSPTKDSPQRENSFRKIMAWLNYSSYEGYDYSRIFTILLWNILILVISLGFLIFSLITFSDLNSVLIWVLPLGWIILLVSGFFVIKNLFPLLFEFPNWFKRQRRWVKLIIILLIAFYIWGVYQTKDLSWGHLNRDPQQIIESKISKSDLNYSNTAFNYINEFREEKNLQKFDKNLNALNLALYLAKDSSSANSLDSSRKMEMSKKFNVSGSVSFFTNNIDKARGDSIEQIVYRWEDNTLWNAPLLNESYKSGAVACYEQRCWMIVTTEDYIVANKYTIKQKILNGFDSLFSDSTKALKSNDPFQPVNTKDNSQFGSFFKGVFDPKSQIDISQLEQEVHNRINTQRVNNGLQPLSWDSTIALIAREHSQDMVNRNFFAHDNPSGEDPTARANRHGYSCMKDYGSYYTIGLAENIAETPVYSNVVGCGSTTNINSLADCIVDGWMGSPGHRENILAGTYTKTGIGIAYSEDDKAYSTQDFC